MLGGVEVDKSMAGCTGLQISVKPVAGRETGGSARRVLLRSDGRSCSRIKDSPAA